MFHLVIVPKLAALARMVELDTNPFGPPDTLSLYLKIRRAFSLHGVSGAIALVSGPNLKQF